MALPYLATLNIAARTAYPLIQKGVRAGLSANRIGSALADAGMGIRRSTLLSIVKRERTLLDHSRNLRFLPFDRAPDPERLPEALTRLRRKYSYQIGVRGYIGDTGEPIQRFVTIASSTIITRRQAESAAMQMVEDDPDTYPIVIERVILDSVLRAGPAGTLL